MHIPAAANTIITPAANRTGLLQMSVVLCHIFNLLSC
jgi:hypothetical protein